MEKTKPTNKTELQKVYVGMLRNIFGTVDIIKIKRTTDKYKNHVNMYFFNNDMIKKLFNILFKIGNKELDDKLINSMGFTRPINDPVSEEDFNNLYLFGKMGRH